MFLEKIQCLNTNNDEEILTNKTSQQKGPAENQECPTKEQSNVIEKSLEEEFLEEILYNIKVYARFQTVQALK